MVDETGTKEKLDSSSEANGRLAIFTPETIREMVDNIQQAAPVSEPGEILWFRRLSAKPYAQALFDTAMEKKQLDRCHSELQKVARLSRDKDKVAFLEDPEVRFGDKVKLLSKELGDTNHLVLNLVYRLLTKRRLSMLPDIADEYQHLLDNYHATVRAEVTTAIPLDDEDELRLSQRLSDMIGKKVILEPIVDPSIIGGIVVRVDGKVLDGSIRSKLAALKRELGKEMI